MIEARNVNRVAPALRRGGMDGGFNRVSPAYARENVGSVNLGKQLGPSGGERREAPRPIPSEVTPRPVPPVEAPRPAVPVEPPQAAVTAPRPVKPPELLRPVRRGQKTALGITQGSRATLRAAFGWNVGDARCDVDVSAFLLGTDGRVPSDDWFVFYGQPASPDGSVRLRAGEAPDRQTVTVELDRLDTRVARIVFVMTINEAAELGLNFGMVREAWMRLMDGSGAEIVSFKPEELYGSITSMVLGELYLRNGEWRFSPVGNGMNIDLAGQCAVYGVTIGE